MQFSFSKVETHAMCPLRFKYRYIDKLQVYDDYDAVNPLVLGTALHKGIETDVKTAINMYYMSYPIITDKHIEEAIKLEYLIPLVKRYLQENYPDGYFETKLEANNFIAYVDYIYPKDDGTVGIIDFKYSNNVDKYSKSAQLHVYKAYLEKIHNVTVSELTYLMIPKIAPRLKKTECLGQFRKRIVDTLKEKELTEVRVSFDSNKLVDYFTEIINITTSEVFEPITDDKLCKWCEYYNYCKNGDELDIIKEEKEMALPSTNRVNLAQANFKKVWIYGAPFSGKTTLADQAETPLNLNTDGNVKYVSMPRLAIKDEVTTTGRITNRKRAWNVFTEAIDDLEKGSEFKTIVVDLLEDVYDHCRVAVCEEHNWVHESDDSFKAYDIVRSEFLRTIKRLLNLPYNIILISHEDTSRDIMSKNKTITAIKPNINDKIANKIAGMVDIVCRVVVDTDGTRTLQFKSDEVVFGGGRLKGVKSTSCDLSWDALMNVYQEVLDSQKPLTAHQVKVEEYKQTLKTGETPVEETPKRTRRAKVEEVVEEPTPVVEEVTETVVEEVTGGEDYSQYNETVETPTAPVEEVAPRRQRRQRTTDEVVDTTPQAPSNESAAVDTTPASEEPVRQRRTRRSRA